MKILLPAMLLATAPVFAADPTAVAADAINTLGIDLLRQSARPGANALLSPYSIQSALAMTWAGADGDTRAEMARVLHFPADEAEVHPSFAALRKALEDVARQSAGEADRMRARGITNDPISLRIANRLFGQAGYDFRESFLGLVKDSYGAPFEPLDFARDPAGAAKHINAWVEEQTQQRIRDLVPPGALDRLTKLVLVNAIYLKAPWAEAFEPSATRPLVFHVAGESVEVPTMTGKRQVRYAKRDGFSFLAVPYRGGEVHFLILLPDDTNGLAGLERKLTPGLLAEGAALPSQEVILHLPKFKLEPPVLSLGKELETLGMKSAFDQPAGSANFDRMAPRRPGDYLYISQVLHKTFLSLDEQGTEAAAATAVVMRTTSVNRPRPEPIEVRVDRPFVFAIQHRRSGACLFLGQVTDPR